MNEPLDVWSHGIDPPFKMRTETPMEKYRSATWDSKEPETNEWIASFGADDVFFDVGANVGLYSLLASYMHPGISCFSFEPMRQNFEALQDNIKMNGFKNIHAIRCAVGSAYGIMGFVCDKQETGSSGGQIVDTPSARKVTVVTIDGLCLGRHAQFQTRFQKLPIPTHVKIDIDGQELEVVKGMRNVMSQIKSLLIEVSKESWYPIIEIMTCAGFTAENRFNSMTPHSRERRAAEGIDAENIIFTR